MALPSHYMVNVSHPWVAHKDDAVRVRSALIQAFGIFSNRTGVTIRATFSDGTVQSFIIKDTSTDGVSAAGPATESPCDGHDKNVIGPILNTSSVSSLNSVMSSTQSFCRDPGDGSPLLIDLGRDGFEFSQENSGIWFDLFDTGTEEVFQWVAFGTNDAFLAVDLNANSLIDNGSELFGVGTTLIKKNKKAKHGFKALKQYDAKRLGGNKDGRLNQKDKIWDKLLLWNDINANGFSEPDEITYVKDSVIIEIKLSYKVKKIVVNNNRLRLWSLAKSDKIEYDLVDIYFKKLLY